MFYDVLDEAPSGSPKTLAVILHGLLGDTLKMADVKTVVREVVLGSVDLYVPTLPYSRKLDSTGANEIVRQIVSDLDEISWSRDYDEVVFIGHSMGGALLRRVFLTGAPHPPDYSGPYEERDDLFDIAKKDAQKHERWASRVRRIVMLANWDKGWSVSDRLGWVYNAGLNFLGFAGRAAALLGASQKLGRTMLDLRRGSPFIVQTRLLWMAYRRWHNPKYRQHYAQFGDIPQALIDADPPRSAVNPFIVEVLGTQDNFVSPQDQVDLGADGDDWARAEPRAYCMMEMPDTAHDDIVDFGLTKDVGKDVDVKKKRREIFAAALTLSPSTACAPPGPDCVRDPSYFNDIPAPIDDTIEHIVFVMHGIRDDGYWTHRIAKAVKEAAAGNRIERDAVEPALALKSLVSLTPTYGYFPMGSFIMPWVRQQKVEWFMDLYVDVKARFPKATMHFVGHSNGTYLAAKSLHDYKAARFGRVYFAGSVVNPEFDWKKMADERRIWRFHNARGATDWVVALLPKSLEYFSDLGGGGFDGFAQIRKDSQKLTQSVHYAKGGHGGAIDERHWGEIASFIVAGSKPFGAGELESGLFVSEQDPWIARFSRLRIGVPGAFSIAAFLALLIVSLWLPERNWEWGAIGPLHGRGYAIWLAAMALFLLLQYSSPQAPKGWRRTALIVLLVILSAGVADFIVTSLLSQLREYLRLDATLPTAEKAIIATFSLAGFSAFVRFILTKF